MIPTHFGSGVLAGLVWLQALGWLWQVWQWLRHSGEVADLAQMPAGALPALPDSTAGAPQLTVVVPACNEEASIEVTLRSLLDSVGIRLQVIAVDDRSTDRTGAIMDKVAGEVREDCPHSIQVLRIAELPEGWLGKPHALAEAARLAQSDWLLFTDGDVVFAPEAASLALRYALEDRADHLVLMPELTMETAGERAMLGAIQAFTSWMLRLWKVSDPTARDFIGVGAFNMVRRSTYEALGGFAALRMEVIEDLRLGWMLKRAGYRQQVARGQGLAAVRWSHGAWGVVRNLEKNLFALYRYRVGLLLLASFGLAAQIVLPILGLAAGGAARLGALVVYAAIAGLYFASRKATGVPAVYALTNPFAACLLLFAVYRSMTLALWRGGVIWRGTLYSLAELRAHAGRFW